MSAGREPTVHIEPSPQGWRVVVMYHDGRCATVGGHRAKFRAIEQARALRAEYTPEPEPVAKRTKA